jgi:hypothetical protein
MCWRIRSDLFVVLHGDVSLFSGSGLYGFCFSVLFHV